jgi:hypothetical protein
MAERYLFGCQLAKSGYRAAATCAASLTLADKRLPTRHTWQFYFASLSQLLVYGKSGVIEDGLPSILRPAKSPAYADGFYRMDCASYEHCFVRRRHYQFKHACFHKSLNLAHKPCSITGFTAGATGKM